MIDMAFNLKIEPRKKKNKTWMVLFSISTLFAVILLIILILNIINGAFGWVVIVNTIEPAVLTGSEDIALEDLGNEELIQVLKDNVSKGMFRKLDHEMPMEDRSQESLVREVLELVVEPRVQDSWNFFPSIFKKREILTFIKEKYPTGVIEFRSWLTLEFLGTPQSSVPSMAGIRTAFLGSLWVILITIVFAFPIGVATAVYMEEYASKKKIWNRIVELNIYNLSGVPSIVYGLLGLALFVRFMEPITSGRLFGMITGSSANGRTILSAGMTLGLLILPIIIINSQEAIKAVPDSLRHGSLGLGASKWQTIWHQVLPNCFDRILTGTIIAISRALGETAPIVVIGASTFITVDPKNIFSKFTTLPIQIYQWTARPQAEFRNVAAAAIIVLLILLLGLNSFAIYMRNRITSKQVRL